MNEFKEFTIDLANNHKSPGTRVKCSPKLYGLMTDKHNNEVKYGHQSLIDKGIENFYIWSQPWTYILDGGLDEMSYKVL